MLVWQIQDTTRWHRTPSPLPARHQLRAGTVSVAFDDRMTPSLVEAAGTYYLPAAVNRQHGFGPVTGQIFPVMTCSVSKEMHKAR